MLKVTIELTGKTWDDVDEALGEVTRFLKERYRCGAEEEEEGKSSYSFDVTGEETLYCDFCEKEIEGGPYRDGALNFCDGKCHDGYTEAELVREETGTDG